MIETLKKGMRVRWVEQPGLDNRMRPGVVVGPQQGEITRIKQNLRTGVSAVLVKNRDGKHFHWIEADSACDGLELAPY